ncbi:uncharacterized protein LOC142349352 [Convolutriloba macropyga]|uniref:uncharacterized protein LOC142349352 n=1 Tax=Convolutriloba macropyga TaxID=536237 RepID=UPI003F51B057
MEHEDPADLSLKELKNPRDKMEFLERNIIGGTAMTYGPFGPRQMTYADFTASGRALRCIENYIQHRVLPWYGNTHTESSYCGLQTTILREEARDVIRQAANAPKEDYAVIFAGSGCTAALHKIISVLEIDENNPCIVFIGPFEHHSNVLPWRENKHVELIRIDHNAFGQFDIYQLREYLDKYKSDPRRKIGSFSKASNITGILVDCHAVGTLMHEYGGIVMWDYATGAPHLKIDVVGEGLGYKDAVFIATHKLIGGPQTPGVLIARRDLFANAVPDKCGGGSVLYVSRTRQRYLDDIEAREESGTPPVVQSIRAGLVYKVKETVGSKIIEDRETFLAAKAIQRLKTIPGLRVLGSLHIERVPIFAFLVLHEDSGLYLHHSYINQLFNDLFGLQVRSGCACAGPYAIDLLGMDEDMENRFLKAFDSDISKVGSLKPGFCRFNLAFYASDQESDFILDVLEFVCRYGIYLLPFYNLDVATGVWSHKSSNEKTHKFRHLDEFRCTDVITEDLTHTNLSSKQFSRLKLKTYNRYLRDAELIVKRIMDGQEKFPDRKDTKANDGFDEPLTWFMTPKESLQWVQNPTMAKMQSNGLLPVFEVAEFPPPPLARGRRMSIKHRDVKEPRVSLTVPPVNFETIDEEEEDEESNIEQNSEHQERKSQASSIISKESKTLSTHSATVQSSFQEKFAKRSSLNRRPDQANQRITIDPTDGNMTININISTLTTESLEQIIQKRSGKKIKPGKQFSRHLVIDPKMHSSGSKTYRDHID